MLHLLRLEALHWTFPALHRGRLRAGRFEELLRFGPSAMCAGMLIERNRIMAALTSHEAFCLANATRFVAVRGRTPRDRTRAEFDCLEAAREFAGRHGDGRTMIYGVTALGNSAHLENA